MVAVSTMCSGWNTISMMSLVSNPQSKSLTHSAMKASHAPVPALIQN
jgi:hypothetical protein